MENQEFFLDLMIVGNPPIAGETRLLTTGPAHRCSRKRFVCLWSLWLLCLRVARQDIEKQQLEAELVEISETPSCSTNKKRPQNPQCDAWGNANGGVCAQQGLLRPLCSLAG